MRVDKIVKEIDKLGLTEKLLLVKDIWDDIAQSSVKLPMPQWQNC